VDIEAQQKSLPLFCHFPFGIANVADEFKAVLLGTFSEFKLHRFLFHSIK